MFFLQGFLELTSEELQVLGHCKDLNPICLGQMSLCHYRKWEFSDLLQGEQEKFINLMHRVDLRGLLTEG